MDASFLGRGWAFPVRVDPRTGRIATVAEDDDIRQAIWIILSTAKGERVMRPDFGCGIHDLVFDSVSTVTAGLLENHVREALIRYEARIEVVRLDVRTAEADRGRLLLELHYRVRRTNHEFNLVYPFFLSEGT
ncbi:MAG TPA: GPW/gp25 family protein [Longimicrobium sp.]|nr:GPW/gp25 family protein [Longimicrobium sp.]